jgi:low affinity Fe/Cu permease
VNNPGIAYSRAVERSEAAESRKKPDGRGPFERFVEISYQGASRAPFFFVCMVIVVGWFVSVPWWVDLKAWQVAIHTVASVMTLLLLALLQNASRRAEEAAQEKMNVLAEALAALMASQAQTDPELDDAVRKLREAVGLEERH